MSSQIFISLLGFQRSRWVSHLSVLSREPTFLFLRLMYCNRTVFLPLIFVGNNTYTAPVCFALSFLSVYIGQACVAL
ncbi:hypothetical protein I7I48_09268 [Histoplasma ohiense]|nr:hypothetical protein I7I48_09268 [Histoplasma ohiense (nom. inval.)]